MPATFNALVLISPPSQYVPVADLGACWYSLLNLFDVGTVQRIWHVDKTSVALFIIITLGVRAFGAAEAILVADAPSLIVLIKLNGPNQTYGPTQRRGIGER